MTNGSRYTATLPRWELFLACCGITSRMPCGNPLQFTPHALITAASLALAVHEVQPTMARLSSAQALYNLLMLVLYTSKSQAFCGIISTPTTRRALSTAGRRGWSNKRTAINRRSQGSIGRHPAGLRSLADDEEKVDIGGFPEGGIELESGTEGGRQGIFGGKHTHEESAFNFHSQQIELRARQTDILSCLSREVVIKVAVYCSSSIEPFNIRPRLC